MGALQPPETRAWASGAKVELHGRRWTLEVVPGGDLEVHLGRRLRVIVPRELDPEARAETAAPHPGQVPRCPLRSGATFRPWTSAYRIAASYTPRLPPTRSRSQRSSSAFRLW